jgi:hypothetical protein
MPINAMIAQGSPDRGASALAITRQNRQLGIENRNRNSLLEMQGQRLNMDQERHGMYQQAFDQGQQDRAATMQSEQAEAQLNNAYKLYMSGNRDAFRTIAELEGLDEEDLNGLDVDKFVQVNAQMRGLGQAAGNEISERAGPFGSSIISDGTRFQVIEPPREPTVTPSYSQVVLADGTIGVLNSRTGEIRTTGQKAPPTAAAQKEQKASEKERLRAENAAGAAENVLVAIKDAKGLVARGTAGFGSETAANRGYEPAIDLRSAIETVKANLGFDRLQQMRDQSPTGGALGQVAVQELVSLQATVASLDQLQSPQDLKNALDKIDKHYRRWQETLGGSKGGATGDWGDRKVVRTGKANGRKVVEYSDGSVEYAD